MLNLSISMVTYKTNLEQVQRAIACCLKSNISKHVVVADNDSGAEYFSQLKELERDCVTIVSTGKNGGYGFGHNYAEKLCESSRCHLVMNADIEFDEGALDELYRYYLEMNNPSVIVPKIVNTDGSFQFQNKRKPAVLDIVLRRMPVSIINGIPYFRRRLDQYEMRDVDFFQPSEIEIASGCFMFCNRKLFNEIGGFDERFFMYFEDFDLSNRLAEKGKILYYPEVAVVHYWARDSKFNRKLFYTLVRSAYLYFQKWGWRLA